MWDVEKVCNDALLVDRARGQETGLMGWLSWPIAAPGHTSVLHAQDGVQELHLAWGKWPRSLLVRGLSLSWVWRRGIF